MTVPAPTRQFDRPVGQRGFVKLDAGSVTPPSAATDVGQVYEISERNFGGDHSPLDEGVIPNSPATFTIDLLGSKVPFTLQVTIRDDSGGYPGPETTTDYLMGPTNTSVTINLAVDETVTALYAKRRF